MAPILSIELKHREAMKNLGNIYYENPYAIFGRDVLVPAYNSGKENEEDIQSELSFHFKGTRREITSVIKGTDPLLETEEAKYHFAMDVHRLSKHYWKGEYDSSYWNEPFMKEYAVKEVDALEEKLADLKDKRDNFKEAFFKKNPYRAEVLLYEEKLACVYELLERE